MKIELGNTVKDSITGFKGIVTGKAIYITGCVQYSVTGKSIKNTEPLSFWFDEDRLTIQKVKKVVVNPKKPVVKPIGGPQFTPSKG